MTAAPIRVVLADDHPMFREGLRTALEIVGGVEIVAEAANGAEAVAAAASTSPDVVIMDLAMPELNGIEATRAIVAARPETRILVLTMFEDDESVFAAMRAGAAGFLLKGADHSEIERALHAVAHGDAIFGASVARRVIEFMTAPRAPEPFEDLTDREREVLDLIAKGWANERIAGSLHLSTKTVRNHVSNILTKLQVTDRSQAIVRAREAGLGTDTRH